jgi:bifunctional non-homologous end joining protein LigD
MVAIATTNMVAIATTRGAASMVEDRSTVEVDGRRLSVSNLEKVLYPSAGFTKGEVIDYYARIAPVLLPHLRDRPASFIRYPNGVETKGFFAKNAPKGTPDWVRTVTLAAPGSTKDRGELDYVVVDDLPTLVWLANLAAIEMHVPQWQVGPRGAPHDPDLLVVDLDPGAPADVLRCAEVALLVREYLSDHGLTSFAKTSGSKGMQVYAPITPATDRRTSDYAHEMAEALETAQPRLVLSRMAKNLRGGKVFVDWSQNNGAKTTVAPYSLRAREQPWVSTPLTWDEVAAARRPSDLQFVSGDVLERVASEGDLFAGLLEQGPRLP